MKSVPVTLSNAIRQSHNLYAQPRLTAEWNLNRHIPVTADNIPNEDEFGYDPEVFPIETIAEQNRPTKGITKARVGETIIRNSSPDKQHVRHYLASDASRYKYWCSPVPTDGSGNFPVYSSSWAASYLPETGSPDDITVVRPHILYNQVVKANKIVVKVENSWASPKIFQLRIRTTVGGGWSTIATTGFDPATGQLSVYWNGLTWTTTKPTGNLLTTNVAGIMFQVSSLGPGYDLDGNVSQYNNGSTYSNTTGANSFLNVIELAACLEADLSNKLISVSDTFDMSEASSIYPIGTTTANIGEITLSNLYNDAEYGISSNADNKPGLFNSDNIASPFNKLSERNALFNLEYVYDINGTEYSVQQFKLYADDWNVSEDVVSIPLRDHSKFFDTEPVPSVFWQDITVSEIIWRLCDLMGFNNYEVSLDTNHLQPTIPYFWTDGEKTLWQVADELSKATQTAVYFDAWGRLQIKSRQSAFSDTGADWTVRGRNSGTELADLINLEPQGEAETNHVTINYYASDVTSWNNGIPTMSRVWEPDGTMALRASVLKSTLQSTDTDYLYIGEQDVALWPYEGMVQIQGELIKYVGKHFVYWTYTKNETNIGGDTYITYSAPVRHTANVTSKAQLDNLHSLTPVPYRYQNSLSGHLKITERGAWNSEIKTHAVEANGWNCRKIKGGVRTVDQDGFSQVPSRSVGRLASTGFAATDFMVNTRGAAVDNTYHYYGTRMKFVNVNRAQQRGGLVFNNDGNNEAGYYIELQESNRNLNIAGKKELNLSALTTSGNAKVLASRPGTIVMDKWYDIDVQITGSTTHRVVVYINGKKTFDVEVTGADRVSYTGKFGMYLIGNTEIEYEYFYAVNKDGLPNYAEDTSFWDYVKGGYTGSHWEQEWVYGTRATTPREKKKYKKATKRWNGRFMDEFGPWVHEVRSFDVKFDPFPVLHSEPMVSNKEVLLIDYAGGTHGARFTLANMSRGNVIAHGQALIPGTSIAATANNVTLIHGRVVEVKEAEIITVKDDERVRTKGKIESTIDSPWVQSRTEARALGEWITSHWSQGADEWSATIFGNPLIEIGDVVEIDYPDQFMTTATHRYFVLSTSSNFDNGIQTILRLRRIT